MLPDKSYRGRSSRTWHSFASTWRPVRARSHVVVAGLPIGAAVAVNVPSERRDPEYASALATRACSQAAHLTRIVQGRSEITHDHALRRARARPATSSVPCGHGKLASTCAKRGCNCCAYEYSSSVDGVQDVQRMQAGGTIRLRRCRLPCRCKSGSNRWLV